MQLTLPFIQAEATPLKRRDKSQEKITSTKNSAFKIVELMHPTQDDHILYLAQKFANEIPLDETIDVLTLKESCINCRHDMDRAYVNCFIVYHRENPVGFLVGTTSPAFHNRRVVAEQKLWYVLPSHRGSRAGMLLLHAYEQWARLNGASQIFTGSANSSLSEATSKMLNKLGYARVGYVHVKEI